jgi:hypothetical protein
MNKAAIKIISINLLIFTVYTLVLVYYVNSWILMGIFILIHAFACLLLAFSDEESLPKGAFIISLLLILLIGIGTCTHLFSESAKHW